MCIFAGKSILEVVRGAINSNNQGLLAGISDSLRNNSLMQEELLWDLSAEDNWCVVRSIHATFPFLAN